jgi:RHS repeat-associated protein
VNDPIGTPERLIGEDGEIAAEYDRTAWGGLTLRAGAKATTPIRLQGQYYDEETGLCYNRYRYYSPSDGRFVSADPLRLGAGPNFYGRGSLFGDSDPWGLAPTANMTLGDELEQERIAQLRSDGWKILPSKYGGGHGPDIVATKAGPDGKTLVRIEECKTGRNGLKMTKAGKQMSEGWIINAEGEMAKRKCKEAAKALESARKDASLIKVVTRGTKDANGKWSMKTKTVK